MPGFWENLYSGYDDAMAKKQSMLGQGSSGPMAGGRAAEPKMPSQPMRQMVMDNQPKQQAPQGGGAGGFMGGGNIAQLLAQLRGVAPMANARWGQKPQQMGAMQAVGPQQGGGDVAQLLAMLGGLR